MAIPKQISRAVPTASGYLQKTIVTVGAERVGSFFDALLGGYAQNIGFTIPFVNIRVSALDAVVYAAVNKGFKLNTQNVVAFMAAKLVEGGIANVPFLRVPGIPSSQPIVASQTSNPNSVGVPL